MYNLCLLQPAIETRDLSCWRMDHFGGAAMPEITSQRLAEALPTLEFFNGFGSTETTSAVALTERGDAARVPDAVGTMVPCAIEHGGRIPINAGGGLIGAGHTVGATGVRMVLDAARQVPDRAGACQVEGARRFATLNIGGSATTVVSFVVQGGGGGA